MDKIDKRVPVTSETRDKLRSLKTGAERYDDVIRRLIREHETEEND